MRQKWVPRYFRYFQKFRSAARQPRSASSPKAVGCMPSALERPGSFDLLYLRLISIRGDCFGACDSLGYCDMYLVGLFWLYNFSRIFLISVAIMRVTRSGKATVMGGSGESHGPRYIIPLLQADNKFALVVTAEEQVGCNVLRVTGSCSAS